MIPNRKSGNSSNPLQPQEELIQNCQIGLDEEEIYYIRQNHDLQIRTGAEPFYLFQRLSGSAIDGTVSQFQSTSPYVGILWTPPDGDFRHPDIRINEPGFVLFNNGAPMNRVEQVDFIEVDNDYFLDMIPGTSPVDANSILIRFNSTFTPGTLTFRSNTICDCVDLETGYPNRQCPDCYGTSIPGGYTQYLAPATQYNPANAVLVRVPMVPESYGTANIGRVKVRNIRHWMRYEPYVSNYDLIFGTLNQDQTVLFEIVKKSDSRLRGILLHQEFETVRLEEDDVRYTLVPQMV